MPPPIKRKKPETGSERPSAPAATEDEYSVIYSKGENVWAYWKDRWFQSRIVGTSSCRHPHDKNRSVPGYKVHYSNWGSKYDEWVMSDCLMARSAENDLKAQKENHERQEHKDSADDRVSKLVTMPQKLRDDEKVPNTSIATRKLQEKPKKESQGFSRPTTRNGGQEEPARVLEKKSQEVVSDKVSKKRTVSVEVPEKKLKEVARAASPEKKTKKEIAVVKTEKKTSLAAANSQPTKPTEKKPRADSEEIECLGSGTFTAFHSAPPEEEEEIPLPVARTKKTKQVKRLNDAGSSTKVKKEVAKEVKKEIPKSAKAIPAQHPLKRTSTVKTPLPRSKAISRDSSPEITAPPHPSKRLKVDPNAAKDMLAESIAAAAAGCHLCTFIQQCEFHTEAAAAGSSAKTDAREVREKESTKSSSACKHSQSQKPSKISAKPSPKVSSKLNGRLVFVSSTTSTSTRSTKPKELKVGNKVVAVQVIDTQASTSGGSSLIGTKQISVNGKETKLVLKCQAPKPENKPSSKAPTAMTSILQTPVRIVTVKSTASSAKVLPDQKPSQAGNVKKPTASVVIPLVPASPVQLTTPATVHATGTWGTPVTSKGSPSVATKVSMGKVTLPLKPGVTVGRSNQVPAVLKRSPAAGAVSEAPPIPVVVPVVVDPEEIKRKENEEKEKERTRQVAAGLISLLAIDLKAPNVVGLLNKAWKDAVIYTDEKFDNVLKLNLHQVFFKHIAYGSVCIRKQADERWCLSEEPHMAAVPFLKPLKTYAVQGLNIRLHPSIQSLGVHRQIKLLFDIPESFLQSRNGPNDTTCMLLRFCQNNGELPAPERHPRNLVLTLNYGQRLIEDLEHGESSVEPTFKRFCAPIEVPKALLKSQNQLVVEWTDCFDIVDPAKDFLLFVEFAERQSHATILKEIQARKVDINDTVEKLHSLLIPMNAPGAKEPIQPSMVFTLLCPMTKKRLTIPVRSKACQHNECFDAPAYLAANAASRSTWTCPLCSKIALPDDLVSDEYVELLLNFSAMEKLEVVRDGLTVFVREIDPKRPPKFVPKAVEGAPLSLTQLVPKYRTALSTNGTFVINLQK